MLWLRSGIAYGWMVTVNDPSVQKMDPKWRHLLRNPAGEGVVSAYDIAEGTGQKGSRILISEDLMHKFFAAARSQDLTLAEHTAQKLSGSAWQSAVHHRGHYCMMFRGGAYTTASNEILHALQIHDWQSALGGSTGGIDHLKETHG